jgi:hypothetical protein
VFSCLSFGERAMAFSLKLDSVAEWGKFPRFCVNTYRWGDKFFNSYDSTYVEGTGYKFNVKFKAESWLDNYDFMLPDNYRMSMISDYCTSAGIFVSYLALTAGYDMNVNKYLGLNEAARRRFNFAFSCALLSARFYWISNDVGTTIKKFGKSGNTEKYDLPFNGINTKLFGVDAFFFFNNKRYSQAAAFNYSKIQKRSQGSFYLGFSYWTQDFNFDFSQLPKDITDELPENWIDNNYKYQVYNHNYSVRVGYGYNWAFNKHWILGVSESPIVGLKHGTFNGSKPRVSLSASNQFRLSAVWNNKQWFGGLILTAENGLYYDHTHSLYNGVFTGEASFGYRFNIW